jgi:RNA polymerase sigma-70 factor (ECF subfamily)
VNDADGLTRDFEAHRGHLRAVAYRMLGSLAEADDAVQESWLRLARADTTGVQNLRGWLTTVVARVCLDMLRGRAARREDPLEARLPDPIVGPADDTDPERHALLADSVGLALLVVLDTLSPAERLAFVLHDIFAVPFSEVGSVMDRSPAAAKQLASRARQRLRGATAASTVDPRRQRQIVDAFLSAVQDGNFDALLAVLDPDVVLRADAGKGPMGPSQVVRGATAVASQVLRFAPLARFARPVLVNGAPGLLATSNGQPLSLLSVTTRDDKIVEINILADPERLNKLDLPDLDVS